jgi:large subunit ribosomal protein L4
MIEMEIKDINNNVKGRVALSENIFKNSASESVVHTAVVSYLANQRQGTHSTKTRGLVSGGGKKPWRQKKTGRARHGSIRSPIWKGGGIVFGPHPRDYYINLPKRMKKTALYKALTMKYADGEISIIESLKLDSPKTKKFLDILKNLGLENKTTLVVLSENDRNIILASRNIPESDVIKVSELNAYHVAVYDHILFTLDALLSLQGDTSKAEVAV